jgi:hypothetical protein
MKVNFKLMGMLLGGLVALGSLAACSKDNEDSKPSTQASSVRVSYYANVSEELLDVANVMVRFIGDNGQVASEQMSATTWTKTVTIALPAKAGLNIQPTLKGSVDEGEYNLSAKGQMAYTWLDQNGQQLQAGSTESTPELSALFYADGLGQYLGAIGANCQLARSFAKDYSVTDTAITWGGNAGDDSTQGTGISDEGATGDNR